MEIAIIRSKTFQRIIFGVLIAVLALASIEMLIYLQKTGKMSQLLSGLLGRLALEKETPPPTEEMPTELPVEKLSEQFLPPTPKVYEEEADKGEGVTHLARKTLKEYLEETEMELDLTSEHKIFIEDYLQKKTGNKSLKLGEKITFSEELIVKAINEALKLTPEQLNNLKKYSTLVPEL